MVAGLCRRASLPACTGTAHAPGSGSGEVGHRHAAAEQVAVAVHVVHPAHGRPVLGLPQRRDRIGRRLARVGMRPLAAQQAVRGVGRVLERVVVLRPFALLDPADLAADGDHRVDEAVQLGQRLAFGRLHHQRVGHGEGQGGRVEAVVDQPLGDVLGHHAAGLLEAAQVQDAFVCHVAVGACVQRGVVVLEARADVVGREDGRLGGGAQAVRAHHADVHPADRQHRGVAERRGTDGTRAARHAGRGMARQVGHEVFHHADGAHAGAAAAVRDAEGLVQVQVAHVAAEGAGRRHAHHGIHVGAVHVHPAAVAVHELAEFLHLRLEHAVRAGVGDHHAGEPVGMLLALGAQVVHVHVAAGVAGRDYHLHAHHLGAGRVGAVGAARDQADVAVALALRRMVGTDGQQARVFALRSGVGLQADAGIARGLAEPGPQLLVELAVALQLVGGCERMHLREFRPGDRDHLARGVQLHGAAAQRDHAAVEREVLVGQLADVAQHARLGMVGVEHRVREEGARAKQFGGDQRVHAACEILDAGQGLPVGGEDRPEQFDVGPRRGFVERDAEVVVPGHAQVGAALHGACQQRAGLLFRVQAQGVECRLVVVRGMAERYEALGQDGREARHALCDALEAFGAVVDGIHAGDHRRQHLRRADVGGGLLAADVLLARLQREAVGRLAVHVHAHAHEAAGQRALEVVAAGHEGGMRAARAHRHAEALGAAHDDVRAPFTGRHQQRERQQVGADDGGGLLGVDLLHVGAPVGEPAAAGRVLDHGGEEVAFERGIPLGFRVRDHHADAQRLGPRADHLDGLRVRVARDDEGLAPGFDGALGERHGLGRGRGLVQHRRVGDGHARKVAHHGLEVDQRLHAALRDLGLVRRVGGVPGGVFQDVAQDHARRVRAVIALADEAAQHAVLRGDRLEFRERRRLGRGGRQLHRLGAGDGGRHDAAHQRGARSLPDDREHALLVRRIDADVAGLEFGGVFERGKRREGGRGHGRGPGQRKGGKGQTEGVRPARVHRGGPARGRPPPGPDQAFLENSV